MNDEDLSFLLTIDPDTDKLRASLSQIAGVTDEIGKTATKSIEASFNRQKQTLAEIRALMDPDILRERVRLTLAEEESTKRLLAAEQKERTAQQGGRFEQLKKELMSGGGNETNMLLGGLLGGGGMLGQIGGMAGEAIGSMFGGAAGGAIGAEVGKALAEMLPKIIAGPAKLLAGAFNTLDSSLKGLEGTLGPVGVGLDLVSVGFDAVADKIKSIPIVGELLGPMLDALGAVPKSIKSILETLTGFTSKASPATTNQLHMAVDDLQAVIGRSFIPIVRLFTRITRGIGDALANILPSASRVEAVMEMMHSTLDRVGPTLKDVVETLGPIMQNVIVGGLTVLTVALDQLATALRGLWIIVRSSPLFMLASAISGRGGSGATASGAAARQAQFTGIEDYQRQIYQTAYSETSNSVPNNVNAIRGLNEIIVDLLGRLPGDIAGALIGAGLPAAAAPAAAAFGAGVGAAAPLGAGVGVGTAVGAGAGAVFGAMNPILKKLF